MKIYIAGPMRGYAAYNFPAFFEAERALLGLQHCTFNPARNDVNHYMLGNLLEIDPTGYEAGQWLLDHPQDFSLRDALNADLGWITSEADALVVLTGWEASKGAQAEVATARAIGIPVYTLEQREDFSYHLERAHYAVEIGGQALPDPTDYTVEIGDVVFSGRQWEAARTAFVGSSSLAEKCVKEDHVAEPEHDPSVEEWTHLLKADPADDGCRCGGYCEHGALNEPGLSDSDPEDEEGFVGEERWQALARLLRGEEVRTTSETGGQKGTKLAAFDQISPEIEMLVAEHFGKGAAKYSAHNFRKGYPWSKSYSALRRHLAAFWAGEEYDDHKDDCPADCVDHTGSLHIVAVIWHAMVLTEFYLHRKEYDDRYGYSPEA